MTKRHWPIIGGGSTLVALAIAIVLCVVMLRKRDARLTQLQTEREHICSSIWSHLAVIVNGKGDSRLHDLHSYARWRFGDDAINRACVGKPYPVDLDAAGTCWALRSDEECYLKPLRELHTLYQQRPWQSH